MHEEPKPSGSQLSTKPVWKSQRSDQSQSVKTESYDQSQSFLAQFVHNDKDSNQSESEDDDVAPPSFKKMLLMKKDELSASKSAELLAREKAESECIKVPGLTSLANRRILTQVKSAFHAYYQHI